jgi:TIR domain
MQVIATTVPQSQPRLNSISILKLSYFFMSKPIVFISHITEEAKLANLIKDKIEMDFLGMIEIFVSSDGESIAAGARWLETISDALKNAGIMIVLCSHNSIGRPWINFEAGAGWNKGIPVVPICHTGLRKVELPMPLSMLQAGIASDSNDLDRLYTLLAEKLESNKPSVEFEKLISDIKEFEHNYGIVRILQHHVSAIILDIPDLKQIFKFNPIDRKAAGTVDTILLNKVKPHLDHMRQEGWLDYEIGHLGNTRIDHMGQQIDLKIEVNEKYYLIAEQLKM